MARVPPYSGASGGEAFSRVPFRFEVLGLEREAWLRVGGADGEPLVYSAPSPPRRPRLAPEAQG